jgi:hypothetical protein
MKDESYVAQLPHALIIILLMIAQWERLKCDENFFDVSEYQSAY